MTAKDRLEELIGKNEYPKNDERNVGYLRTDRNKSRDGLRVDLTARIPTTQTQMLEDLEKAWPITDETRASGYQAGHSDALAEAWAVVEGYLGGEK